MASEPELSPAEHFTGLPPPAQLHKDRYLTPDFAARERERLWSRVWLYASPVDFLREPGCFVTTQLGGTRDVLVHRGKDGVLRAFHNVCRHRGRRLVVERHGRTQSLRCSMHHWQYDDAGVLASAPDRETFGCLLDPLPRLAPVVCDTWRGHVWVHLGQPEQSLAEWLSPVTAALDHYDFENYAFTELTTVDMACNWKTVMDVYNELYHVQGIHPGLLPVYNDLSGRDGVYGSHMVGIYRVAQPSPRLQPTSGINPAIRQFLTELGVDTQRLGDDPARIPGAIRTALESGGPLRLTDEEFVSCRNAYVFPSFNINAYPHVLHMQSYRPHPSDPQRAWYDFYQFTRVKPGTPRPTPLIRSFVRPGGGPTAGPTLEEDVDAALEVQRGMQSPGFEVLTLGGHEARIIHMHNMIDRYLATPEA